MNTPTTVVSPVAAPAATPVRLDSSRLTSRPDSGVAYGATRSASASAATTTVPTPPSAPKVDSASSDRIPPAPKEVADALFKEFATAVNGRVYTRITAAYQQPSDAQAVQLWQDFLVFVRDYTPNARVRSTMVVTATDPPTITATIDFRWSTDAGFDRARSATFTGVGVPISGGWQLRRVSLAKRFW
jgi:hypothetical protein